MSNMSNNMSGIINDGAATNNMIVYIIIVFICVVILFLLGNRFSAGITDKIHYILFWLLYITSIMTVLGILLSFYFFMVLRKKTGRYGIKGEEGEAGDTGEAGICKENCRAKIAIDTIMNVITKEANTLAGLPSPQIVVKNQYIKQLVKSQCSSGEFAQLIPYRGVNDLVEYMGSIWREWVELLYTAGGRKYFETIGAENEFEWAKDNPFDEIKKYDIFYWGLGASYRPEEIENCSLDATLIPNNIPVSDDKGQPNANKESIDGKNLRDGIGWSKTEQKELKYSVLAYLAMVPEAEIFNKYEKLKITKIENQTSPSSTNSTNSYKVMKYDGGNNTSLCAEVVNSKILYNNCNTSKQEQLWSLEMQSPSEVKLKSSVNSTYLKPVSIDGSIINDEITLYKIN